MFVPARRRNSGRSGDSNADHSAQRRDLQSFKG
jgi:hypothetical protein